MGRVSSNAVGLAYAEEASLGVLGAGPVWHTLEPNNITAFGAALERVSRNPISRSRQRKKGSVVDLNSPVGFEADLTLGSFRDFLQGFMFGDTINRNLIHMAVSAVSAGNDDEYTITALSAGDAGKIVDGTLFWARGFSVATNNGLKTAKAGPGDANTTLGVDQDLAVDTTGQISVCGFRLAKGAATWGWNADTKRGTLTLAAHGLAARGLQVGMFVHFGSTLAAGGAVQNGLQANRYGLARVVALDAGSIQFDKVDLKLRANVANAQLAANIDILFGEFARNADASNDAVYRERSFQIEGTYPGLGDANATEYEYALGNFCNSLAFNLPLTNKATATFGFIGTDAEPPVPAQKTNAAAARAPVGTTAYNTSADIARLRVTEADEDGLTTDFKSLTVTFNNNVSPEKVIGTLGAKFMNVGDFTVDITGQMLFTNKGVLRAIRNNETVSMDFALRNEDGVIVVDVPEMTLGGGGREFPENQTVLINTTAEAHQDARFNISVGVSIIPAPIPA